MSEKKKYNPLIFGIVALILPLVVSAEDISGWRTPFQSDLNDASGWRKEDPGFYLTAKGDFDGDGKTDTAQLLVNDKENKMGLFVTLTSRKNAPAILVETTEKKEIRSMGIKSAKPDKYKTACGKGYWDCKKGDPATLNLKHPAIDFFTYESANSYFVWDKKAKKFTRIWMSD